MSRTRRATAWIVAVLALSVLVIGPAAAARLITGKDIRDGSISGADVRNGSITVRDLAASARAGRGAPGARGPEGPRGFPGRDGVEGARGLRGEKGDAGLSGLPVSARVQRDGSLLDGERAVDARQDGDGRYTVLFDGAVSSCTRIAALGPTRFASADEPNAPGEISTALVGSDQVEVRTFDSVGVPSDAAFHLVLACPA